MNFLPPILQQTTPAYLNECECLIQGRWVWTDMLTSVFVSVMYAWWPRPSPKQQSKWMSNKRMHKGAVWSKRWAGQPQHPGLLCNRMETTWPLSLSIHIWINPTSPYCNLFVVVDSFIFAFLHNAETRCLHT